MLIPQELQLSLDIQPCREQESLALLFPGRNLWNVDVNGNALEEWKAFPQEKK